MIDIIGNIDFLISVGANDGTEVLVSHYIKNNVLAVLIEPQRIQFDQMQRRYRFDKSVVCVNVAISEKDGIAKLYGHPNDGDGTRTANHGSSLYPIPNSKFQSVVNCWSYKTLTRAFLPPDLLVLDTEGYDANIINGIFNLGWYPTWLLTENIQNHYYIKNAQIIEEQKRQALIENNYKLVFENGHDFLYKLNDE